jgi:hypothetical protein
MSTECTTIVWKRDFGNATRKVIAARLADHADDEGRGIWPSVERVAAQCNTSPRTVQRTLAAFVEEGILKIVAEGGKGRRSTTHYDFVMTTLTALPLARWVPDAPNPKGDTVSPLENEPEIKGDTDDANGDTDDALGCHGVTQTVIEPPIEPSIERERASEREEGSSSEAAERAESKQAIEREFKRWFHTWPTYVSDSEPDARKAWFDLSTGDRTEAVARQADYLEEARKGGRTKNCSAAVYLRERRWEKLAPKPAVIEPPKVAAPFGKAWGSQRFMALLKPAKTLPALTALEERIIDQSPEKESIFWRDKKLKYGWPQVVAMHEAASAGRGVTVNSEVVSLGEDFQQVMVGGELWEAWKRFHAAQCWPWLPDTGRQGWVWFPAVEDGWTDMDGAVAAAVHRFRRKVEGHVHAAAE